MILYLDSSALVKLYFNEEGRDIVIAAIEASEEITTSTVAYPETRATLARKHRERLLDDTSHEQAIADLDGDWLTFVRVDATTRISYRAGHLAHMHALRGFDAVHLASALHFAAQFAALTFLAFDKRLNDAARAAALTIYGDVSDVG